LGPKEGHDDIREFRDHKNFFLWGLLPQKHYVFLDRKVQDLGHISGANFHIEEYQSFMSMMISVITLGMWIPKDYRISLHGLKPDYE